MPDSNIDGIKKLSKDDLEKSRKIVLDSIGEGAINIEKIEDKENFIPKKMDSLSFIKKEEPKKTFIPEKKPEINKEAISAGKLKILDAIRSDEESNKKITPKPPVKIPEVPKKINFTALSGEKKKEDLKYAPDFNKFSKSVFNLSKGKEVKYPDKNIENNGINALEKPSLKKPLPKIEIKKIINFHAIFEKIKIYFKNFQTGLKIYVLNFGKYAVKAIKMTGIIFLLFIILYAGYGFLVLRTGLGEKIPVKVFDYFPVPAIIYKYGIVSYSDYKNLKNNYNKSDFWEFNLDAAFKKNISTGIILNELALKYKLNPDNFKDDETLINSLNRLIIYDSEINQVPISRINKIKLMIDNKEDFLAVSEKYGDEKGRKYLNPDTISILNYRNAIKNLRVNDISGIVAQPEGYYIFKCDINNDNSLALSYVLVKSVSLENYINESAENYNILILAK